MTGAALYECRVRHVRRGAVANDFTYGTYQWLVDLADLPRLPRAIRALARFQAEDHLGGSGEPGAADRSGASDGSHRSDGPTTTIRENVLRYLAANGVELRAGRILMLANARVLGHVFNPLTVYWCFDARGDVVCVIAEVHNTYGQRHEYLLFPDAAGRSDTAKEFYVSPFLPLDGGTYHMSLPVPGERLSVSIRLELPGRPPFVASVHGARRPGTERNLLYLLARHPLPTLTVSARIRWQGIRLFLRGLPVLPRPDHPTGGT